MDDEKPSCSYISPKGSKGMGGPSQADIKAIASSSDWTSAEDEEGEHWIGIKKDDGDSDSTLSGSDCLERKHEQDSYDADCSEESEDEGKTGRLTDRATAEHGKLSGTFQNQDVPRRENGNHTEKKKDKCVASLVKVFSEQKQPKPNPGNKSLIQRYGNPRKRSNQGKSYADRIMLRKHENAHLKKKPYECSECGKRYLYKRNLRDHKNRHQKKKPYKCSECGKRYACRYRHREHQKAHLRKKLWKCSKCGKICCCKRHFKEHEKTHPREKPYECSDCGKGYHHRGKLRRHREKCPKKKHQCAKCGKCFVYGKNFKKHQKNHIKQKSYGGKSQRWRKLFK